MLIRPSRLLVALTLLLSPAILRAATPAPETAPAERGALTGQLLIAAPEIGDPRFDHTVILVVRHDKSGALGIVLNRPVEERSLASLLDAAGADSKGIDGKVLIYAGGPVEPEVGFVIHSAEYRRPETIAVDSRIAVTSSIDVLRDMGHGKGPRKALVAFGYAGWSAGQLENEIARHDWYTAPADPALVFDEERDKLWESAMARRTHDL